MSRFAGCRTLYEWMRRAGVSTEVLASSADSDEPVATDLETAFRRFAPHVAAIGFRLLGRDGEVEDLVQDVFLEACRQVTKLRDARLVRAWLTTVAVRNAMRRLKRRRLRGFLGMDDEIDYHEIASTEASPEERAQVAALYRALDQLPAGCRVAWVLRHVEGEDLSTVARLCGCSLATVKRWIRRASDVLGEAVSDA